MTYSPHVLIFSTTPLIALRAAKTRPLSAVLGAKLSARGQWERTLRRPAVCFVRLRTCGQGILPTRNPASRFGYEGLGGPISAGAAHSFNGIAPSTPCARLTSAIAQQAQQMCGVLPDRGRKEPSRRMRRQTCGILQSVWPYASKGSYACFQDPAKLKQTFDFSAMRLSVKSRAVASGPHNA